jgi:hypothetical protein
MNHDDTELLRRLASATPVTDSQVARFDLRDAETELLEEIMATTTDTVDDPGADSARVLDLHGQPSGPDRRHAGFRVAVAAAAVAALAGGLLLTRGDSSGGGDVGGTGVASPGASDDVELPRLMPGDVPDDLEITDFHLYGQWSSWDYLAAFGHASETAGELPVVDLNIRWDVANEDSGSGASPGLTAGAPVRGHDGFACAGTACADVGPGVQASIEWTERPGTEFSMTSPSLTVEQLVAIADGLEIGGHDVGEDDVSGASFVIGADEVHLGALPDDVTVELADLGRRTYAFEGPPTPMDLDADGKLIGPHPAPDFLHFTYRAAEPTEQMSVAVEPGEGFDIAARLADEGGEPIDDVRGHPAWAFTLPPDSGFDMERRSIVWEEEPGVLVTIETFGTDYDHDVLRDVAESMHLASDAEWEELLDVSDTQGNI